MPAQELVQPELIERPAMATPGLAPHARSEPAVIATRETARLARPEPPAIPPPQPTSNARPEPTAAPAPTPRVMSGLAARLAPGLGLRRRPGPPPDLPPISRAFPPARMAVARGRADFQFADSSIRYLRSGELLELSADRLLIARNEIFARKGLYFRDDALRAYFAQFPWYRPYAWEVPLSPIEQANVDLIWSFEAWRASYARPM